MCWEGVKSDRRNDLTREVGREAEESANNHKEGPHYKTAIRNRRKVKIFGCIS